MASHEYKIPETPSKTINDMLKERCGKEFESPVKGGIAVTILYIFQGITMLYDKLNPDRSKPSHSMWMASCGVVSVTMVIAIWIAYNLVTGSAFIVHALMYYFSVGLALFAIAMGVAGMVFFDKKGESASPGFTKSE